MKVMYPTSEELTVDEALLMLSSVSLDNVPPVLITILWFLLQEVDRLRTDKQDVVHNDGK